MNCFNVPAGLPKVPYRWSLSDLDEVEQNGLTVFSCFAGAGGSSMGYKLAGYDVVGCNEIDPKQMALYERNLNPKYKYLMDIRELTQKAADRELPEELYNLFILDASFPCTLFSVGNLSADDKKGVKIKYAEGAIEQVLDDLADESIKLAKELQPAVMIMENVMGLLFEKNKPYVRAIEYELAAIGYKLVRFTLNAADVGVPQSRKRVFFAATRLDVPTISEFDNTPILTMPKPQERITLGDIYHDNLGRLPTEKTLSLIDYYIPKDKNLGDINERIFNKRSCFNHKLCREDEMVGTIRAGTFGFSKMGEGREYRNLSDVEMIQCSSFPLDYDFLGKGVNYPVGMSVPPLMMKAVAQAVFEQWGEYYDDNGVF